MMKKADMAKSVLLGVAIGDALGVPVEFSWRHALKDDPVIGMRAYGTWGQPAGVWSDDTSMTVATMDSIARLQEVNYDDIMKNFVRWAEDGEYTVNGLFDIGNTTHRAIRRYKGQSPLTCGLTDIKSNGNGSLMRVAPFGLYIYSMYGVDWSDEAFCLAHNASRLTHGNEISQMSCGVYCLLISHLLNGEEKGEAYRRTIKQAGDYYGNNERYAKYWEKDFARLRDCNGFIELPENEIESSGYVMDSLEAAVWSFFQGTNYLSTVLTAVNLGRDTDTIGAITGGLAGAYYGYKDIPSSWLKTLKRRGYLEDLAQWFSEAL